MGNLIDEIKAIKNSAEYYYITCNIWDDSDYNKYKEYSYQLNEYRKAVKWMRMCNIEIDINVK